MSLDLQNLNNKQREAVEFSDGVARIASVAGSGKTRVLTYRIANMILNKSIKPENILVTTFSKKAAEEMKERLQKLVSIESINKLTIGTFHSIAFRILRREYDLLNHPLKNAFAFNGAISDSVKKWYMDDAMKSIDMNPDNDRGLNAKEVLRLISNAKNDLIDVKRFYEESITKDDFEVAKLYKLFEDRKNKEVKIDFDDMPLKLYELFINNHNVLKTYQNKFQYVLIDEAQDNNFAQYELVRLIAEPHNNIMLVGDDDQSLYGFRGAKPQEFINFQNYYPNSITIKLEKNYRSMPAILDIANKIITNNSTRLKKTLVPFLKQDINKNSVDYKSFGNEDKEAEFISNKILEHYVKENIKYKECTVLYRTNAQTRALEDQFIQNQIPYVIHGGISFYELKEVKDLICYLRLVVNNDDNEAFERIINVPSRYLGKAFLNSLKSEAKRRGVSLYKALKWVNMKPYQHRNVMGFMNLIDNLEIEYRSGNLEDPQSLIKKVLEKTEYEEMLRKENEKDDENDRVQNIQTLLTSCSKYKDTSEFVDYISNITNNNKKKKFDAVQLMTIHRSKGLEFKKVFLIGMSENILPHKYALECGDPNAIEEERRLAYVGATRAMEDLYMSSLESFNNQTTSSSRFIYEAGLKTRLC